MFKTHCVYQSVLTRLPNLLCPHPLLLHPLFTSTLQSWSLSWDSTCRPFCPRLVPNAGLLQEPTQLKKQDCTLCGKRRVIISLLLLWWGFSFSRRRVWRWLVTRPDDGGSKHLRNVFQFPPGYTVQHPRRHRLTFVVFFFFLDLFSFYPLWQFSFRRNLTILRRKACVE
jgi:hypothetical protein